jgi:hypothetical protein
MRLARTNGQHSAELLLFGVAALSIVLDGCMCWLCGIPYAMLGLAEKISSSLRMTCGSVRVPIMLLAVTMMSSTIRYAFAACPSMTAGVPLLNGCARPCRISLSRTNFFSCNPCRILHYIAILLSVMWSCTIWPALHETGLRPSASWIRRLCSLLCWQRRNSHKSALVRFYASSMADRWIL